GMVASLRDADPDRRGLHHRHRDIWPTRLASSPPRSITNDGWRRRECGVTTMTQVRDYVRIGWGQRWSGLSISTWSTTTSTTEPRKRVSSRAREPYRAGDWGCSRRVVSVGAKSGASRAADASQRKSTPDRINGGELRRPQPVARPSSIEYQNPSSLAARIPR